MYCRKCGKFIDYEGDICKECAREEAVSAEEPVVKAVFEDEPETKIIIEDKPVVESVIEDEPVVEAVFESEYEVKETEENTESAYVFIEKPQSVQPQQPSRQPNTNIKLGFGTALACLIFGIIASGLSSVAGSFLVSAFEIIQQAPSVADVLMEVWICVYIGIGVLVVGFGLAIPAIINGIKAIKIFRGAVQNGGVKPIATLVMGIIGLVSVAYVLLNIFTFMLDFSFIVTSYPELL